MYGEPSSSHTMLEAMLFSTYVSALTPPMPANISTSMSAETLNMISDLPKPSLCALED